MTQVRLEAAAPLSRVKHSSTEPLCSHIVFVLANRINGSLKCNGLTIKQINTVTHLYMNRAQYYWKSHKLPLLDKNLKEK